MSKSIASTGGLSIVIEHSFILIRVKDCAYSQLSVDGYVCLYLIIVMAHLHVRM
jgi:hypothetical protein